MDNQRLITFAQELIRERSMSGEEQAVVTKVAAEMKALGFDQVWVDEYGSVVGVIEGKKPGKTLLLDGHCDIVDARAEDWTHDPFAAVIDAVKPDTPHDLTASSGAQAARTSRGRSPEGTDDGYRVEPGTHARVHSDRRVERDTACRIR